MPAALTTLADLEPSDFPQGDAGWHVVELARTLASPVRVPLFVARGSGPGPTALIIAGVHGDEFEGPAAIHALARALDPAGLSGTVIALPVANPFAFDAQIRESPPHLDGLNLARQFPGRADGSPTQRLAHTLFAFAARLLGPDDLFVDLHSGGTRYEYLPMVGFHATADAVEEKSRRLAAAFGFPHLWRIPESPSSTNTFNGAVARAGIPTIGTETRGRGGLVPADIPPLAEGLRRVLIEMRMLPGDLSPPSGGGPLTTRTLLCGRPGLFVPLVDLDVPVTAGAELARILSLTGDVLETLTSPAAGRIWAIRRFASVRPGDIAFMIGLESG